MTIDCTYTINYLQKYFFFLYIKSGFFKSNKRITQCALLWVLADDQNVQFHCYRYLQLQSKDFTSPRNF